ncbi:MAG: ribose-phosphate diphosphokinase, partial [Bacteroidales bacterium]|nr:ribose-phosphate diphosphokinase [Bacteroidales bacterium]
MPEPIVSIFSGRASEYLADKIAKSYGSELGKATFTDFSDGEFQPSFEENIRGRDVFLVQSTFAPTDNLFEMLLMADAARRASARKITAVIPYFGFARQDRKDKPRVTIAAKLVANLLITSGISRIITIDLHADQIQGFFDVPVDHLYASNIF